MSELNSVPIPFLARAADVLGDTKSGLSGRSIIKAFLQYGERWDVHVHCLFAVSDGRCDSFDMFLREVQDTQAKAYSDDTGQYIRRSHARIAFTGISRSVGIKLTAEVTGQLRAARRRKG